MQTIMPQSTDKTPTPKPTAVALALGNIPKSIKKIDRWILWRYTLLPNGNWTKTPHSPNGGHKMDELTPVGDNFGRQLVQGKLAEGFTVIRKPNGDADFGLGIIELGKTPSKPYNVHGSSRIAYENTRTEMHGWAMASSASRRRITVSAMGW